MYRRAAIRQFSTSKPRQLPFLSRVPKIANSENVKLFSVRFRPPPLHRRIFRGLLYNIPPLAVAYYLLLETAEVGFSEDDEKMMSDGSVAEDNEEELEDGVFIPFGWYTKNEKTYYKRSDPEWLAYVDLARDKKRVLALQAKLAKEIRQDFARRRRESIQIDKGRFFTWILFPSGPPQDYRVSGLEFGPDFIAWSTKIIPRDEYEKVVSTVFPKAGMKATWVVLRYHFDMQANKIRKYFGWKQYMDPETKAMASFLNTLVREKKKMSPPLVPPTRSKEETSTSSSSQKVDASTSSPGSPSDEKDPPPPFLSSLLPKAEQVPVTTFLFMSKMLQARTKSKLEPPRGCIEVKGTVEVLRPSAITILDVEANYDLNINEFTDRAWTVRETRARFVRPRG